MTELNGQRPFAVAKHNKLLSFLALQGIQQLNIHAYETSRPLSTVARRQFKCKLKLIIELDIRLRR